MAKFARRGRHIGADVHGIDLSSPLQESDVAAIREGLLEHLVLFFRDQQLLSFDEHKALARYFGDPEITRARVLTIAGEDRMAKVLRRNRY